MRPVSVAFTSALLLFLPAAPVNTFVPAPENVVVSCENLRTVVQWDYPHHQPSAVFNIRLESSESSEKGYLPREANTTAHEFDLTKMVWDSEDQYMAFNYISITAVTGSNRSEPALSKTFSFNNLKTVDIKCELEFPPVNLTVDDSVATVSIQNPFHFYKELRRTTRPTSASFSVQSKDSHHGPLQCRVEEKTCKLSIDISPDTKLCVNIDGHINEGVGKIQLKKTGPVCATDSTGEHWLVVGLMMVIVAVVIAALTVAICKLKAWTMKPRPMPNTLAAEPQINRPPTHLCDPTLSSIYITGSRPSPLAPGEELSPGEDSPDKLLIMEEEAEALIPAPRPHEDLYLDQDLDPDKDSAESTQTEYLSSESEVEVGAYETRPQLVAVEMGEGDTVFGYTGS